MTKLLGMLLPADGSDEAHIRQCLIQTDIYFGKNRKILADGRLPHNYKVEVYKGMILSRATKGCQVIDLTRRTQRKYMVFNAK